MNSGVFLPELYKGDERMTEKERYKEMIESNGYIDLRVVGEFLRKGMIADYELVAEIFDDGMSNNDIFYRDIA